MTVQTNVNDLKPIFGDEGERFFQVFWDGSNFDANNNNLATALLNVSKNDVKAYLDKVLNTLKAAKKLTEGNSILGAQFLNAIGKNATTDIEETDITKLLKPSAAAFGTPIAGTGAATFLEVTKFHSIVKKMLQLGEEVVAAAAGITSISPDTFPQSEYENLYYDNTGIPIANTHEQLCNIVGNKANCTDILKCLTSKNFKDASCLKMLENDNVFDTTLDKIKQLDLPTIKAMLITFGFMQKSTERPITLAEWTKRVSAKLDTTTDAALLEKLSKNESLVNLLGAASQIVRNQMKPASKQSSSFTLTPFSAPTLALAYQQTSNSFNSKGAFHPSQPPFIFGGNLPILNGGHLVLFGGNPNELSPTAKGMEIQLNNALNALKSVNKEIEADDLNKIKDLIGKLSGIEKQIIDLMNKIQVFVNTEKSIGVLQTNGPSTVINLDEIIDTEKRALSEAKQRLQEIKDGKVNKLNQFSDLVITLVGAMQGLRMGNLGGIFAPF
jgi:hypothetical protein